MTSESHPRIPKTGKGCHSSEQALSRCISYRSRFQSSLCMSPNIRIVSDKPVDIELKRPLV